MCVLMKAGTMTQKTNYALVVEEILGKKAGIFLSIIFIGLTFGAVVLFFIISATIMPNLLI